MDLRKGSEILADELNINHADMVWHVPGESFLSALDALAMRHPEIQSICCRHENGAAQMAEAYGKLTGRPGIVFVTRSPGATNAVNGIHTAFQDASPVILIIGQVKRSILEREAFMSYDFRTLFRPMTKWVGQIDSAARIPEFIQRAYQTAMSGRKGPVVLVIPEDVLEETCRVEAGLPALPSRAGAVAQSDIDNIFAMLSAAENPLLIVGGGGWDVTARNDIQRFAEQNSIPVVTAFRRRDIIDHRLPCYAGEIGIGSNPALLKHIRDTDFILVCNDALSDVNTIGAGYMEGFTLFSIPCPTQKIVHVMPDHGDLNRVFRTELALVAEVGDFAQALAQRRPIDKPQHRAWMQTLRAAYLREVAHQPCPGKIDLPAIMGRLREKLPEDAIVTNGVGAYATWSQRYFPHYALSTQLGPISGTMGYSLPAAIAAKLLFPQRTVVCLVGDGCFQMSSEELATAVQYGAAIIIVIFNNNLYGTIRIHEVNRLSGRAHGTDLVNPDFCALARAYGAHAEKVAATGEFMPAFERCLQAGKPALIELEIEQETIHARYSLSELRARNKK
ncbi:thiamine pyrophosphate-binding protein [Sodalis sp. RH21]|uniref:thiamine pyrophosphate-binding protein n=1 Tax=unclassified Sodalis (in: enterobacteria) TaxID=2636512 RepID=UPI0039B395EA